MAIARSHQNEAPNAIKSSYRRSAATARPIPRCNRALHCASRSLPWRGFRPCRERHVRGTRTKTIDYGAPPYLDLRTAGLLAALAARWSAAARRRIKRHPRRRSWSREVLSQKITDWDEYSGRFQAIDTVEVRPRVSGYIDRVLFREGQAVKQGETLIVIDPRPYQADFDRAKAGLELAKAQRELATLEAERVHKLKDSGAVSQEELDERVSALHQQEASVAAAQAAFNAAALNLRSRQCRRHSAGWRAARK